MHLHVSIAAVALVANAAAVPPMSPLERETAVWEVVKAKQMDVFEASMSPDFVGVYAEGTHDRARELSIVRTQKLRSFVIRNFHSRMLGEDDMLMTYSADVRGTYGGESFSGRYWNTSLWHLNGDRWVTVYHGEAKHR